MPSRVAALSCCAALVLLTLSWPAHGWWIENHVLGDEVRIEVDRDGKALVEHRITLKTNGSVRLESYTIEGVDRDAVPQDNSYAIPASDALSNSLDSATPVTMEVRLPEAPEQQVPPDPSAAAPQDSLRPAELVVRIDSDRGLRRGTYVFVLRYRTDLRARGMIERDGSMVAIRWVNPTWDDGFDNARVLFVVPSAPTPPRALDNASAEPAENEAVLLPRYLSEVRRAADADEIELLRSYLPKGEAVAWSIRVDPRALEPLPAPTPAAIEPQAVPGRTSVSSAVARSWLVGAAATLLLIYTLLTLFKARQVARQARQVAAVVRPWVPLPVSLRALLAGMALTGGVGLQLLGDRPFEGSLLVVAAAVLSAHGAARSDPAAAIRGPGRWLTVREQEALRPVARASGGWLDASTRLGKLTLAVALALLGAAVSVLWVRWDAPYRAGLIALDGVALLALWGTGCRRALPPDMAVAPIAFFRKLTKRMRRAKAGRDLKVVARLRLPEGAVDPDEIRLLVAPRLPLRGFAGIEVGLTYVTGPGARVAMPEVLLRFGADSPCERAVASLASHGRSSPGRKPGERVLAFAPRFPTVRMTSEIVVALAARVGDLSKPQPIPERTDRADAPTTRAAA